MKRPNIKDYDWNDSDRFVNDLNKYIDHLEQPKTDSEDGGGEHSCVQCKRITSKLHLFCDWCK